MLQSCAGRDWDTLNDIKEPLEGPKNAYIIKALDLQELGYPIFNNKLYNKTPNPDRIFWVNAPQCGEGSR